MQAEDVAEDYEMCNRRDNLITEKLSCTMFKVNCQKFSPIYDQGTREETRGEAPHQKFNFIKMIVHSSNIFH